jgi:hypothetical protein
MPPLLAEHLGNPPPAAVDDTNSAGALVLFNETEAKRSHLAKISRPTSADRIASLNQQFRTAK